MTGVAIVACLLAEAAIGYGLWRQAVRLRAQQATLARARQRLAEAERARQAREALEVNRQRVEDTVDWTTATVESVHRTISDLSFDLWGEHGGPARTIHDRTSERVYSGIREVNRGVGSFLSGLLDGRNRDRRD